MKNILDLIMATIIYSGTVINTFNSPAACDHLKKGEKGFIRLTKTGEPGKPLIIFGKVLEKHTNLPVNNASLFLYQADSSGNYKSWFFGYRLLLKSGENLRLVVQAVTKYKPFFPEIIPEQKTTSMFTLF